MRSFPALALFALAVASRLLPHAPNMTAVSAVGIAARERFGIAGLMIPLSALAVTDAIIGFYDWKLLVSVYASFVLVALLGAWAPQAAAARILARPAAGAILFFVITNTVVWAGSAWYPHTLMGLLACYAAGVPFLLSMLLGDIVFGHVLSGRRIVSRSPQLSFQAPPADQCSATR